MTAGTRRHARPGGWRAGETSHSERHMGRGPGASIARGARGEAIEADVQRVTQRLSPQGWERDAR